MSLPPFPDVTVRHRVAIEFGERISIDAPFDYSYTCARAHFGTRAQPVCIYVHTYERVHARARAYAAGSTGKRRQQRERAFARWTGRCAAHSRVETPLYVRVHT